MSVTGVLTLIPMVVLLGYVFWSSQRLRKRADAERPRHERRARIAFLLAVTQAPTGVAVDRAKARDELEVLFAEVGFGCDAS